MAKVDKNVEYIYSLRRSLLGILSIGQDLRLELAYIAQNSLKAHNNAERRDISSPPHSLGAGP